MAIESIYISIPDTLKTQIEEVVDQEGYRSMSEFFCHLVRDHLDKRRDSLLLEELTREEATPLTKSDLEDIRKRAMDRLRANDEK